MRAISESKVKVDRQTAARAQAEDSLRRQRGSTSTDERSDKNRNPLSFSLELSRDSFVQAAGKIQGAIDSVDERPLRLPVRGGVRLPVGTLKKRDTKEIAERPESKEIRKDPASNNVHTKKPIIRETPPSPDVNNQRVILTYGALATAFAVKAYAKYLHAGEELTSCIASGVSLDSASPFRGSGVE